MVSGGRQNSVTPVETENEPPEDAEVPSTASSTKRGTTESSPLASLPSPPASSNAPINPFAVKSAQADKRPRGIAESLSSLMGSPSPKR